MSKIKELSLVPCAALYAVFRTISIKIQKFD